MTRAVRDAAGARPRVGVFGYLSLDAVICDGVPYRDVPGGGALYAALGARSAGGWASIRACLPSDFPRSIVDGLSALGVDCDGLVQAPHPTRRARLVEHGARRLSPHHADPEWLRLTRALAPAPGAVEGLEAAVLCPMPADAAERILDALPGDCPVVLDTSEAYATTDRARILDLASRVAVFAPSLAETRLLCPGVDDEAAAQRLSRIVPLLVVKRGPDGLAVYENGSLRFVAKPRPVDVVDTTGAGDATCGALAVGAARRLPLDGMVDLALVAGHEAVMGLGPAGFGLDGVNGGAELSGGRARCA